MDKVLILSVTDYHWLYKGEICTFIGEVVYPGGTLFYQVKSQRNFVQDIYKQDFKFIE